MSNVTLCRVEPYLQGKIIFSFGGEIYAIKKEELDRDVDDLHLITNKHYPINGLSAPLTVQIQITNRCNFSCGHCYVKAGKALQNEMTDKEIYVTLDRLKEWGVLQIQWAGGEVFMRNNFWSFVEYADSLGFEQVLLTNGSFFGTKDGPAYAKKAWNYFFSIQISINGFEDVFNNFTGGNHWSVFCRAINQLALHKPKGRELIGTTVVTDNNVEQIPQIIDFAKEKIDTLKIGGEVPAGRSSVTKETAIQPLFRSWDLVQEARAVGVSIEIRHVFDKKEVDHNTLLCPDWQSDRAARTFMYIRSSGVVYPFPILSDVEDFIGGSVLDSTLEKVWNSEPFNRYRNITKEQIACGSCTKFCQVWPRHQYIENGALDLMAQPFAHPGCPL